MTGEQNSGLGEVQKILFWFFWLCGLCLFLFFLFLVISTTSMLFKKMEWALLLSMVYTVTCTIVQFVILNRSEKQIRPTDKTDYALAFLMLIGGSLINMFVFFSGCLLSLQ